MSMTSDKVPRFVLRQEHAAFSRERRRLQDRVADQITAFSGSMAFVYLHVVWFALWCIGNLIWWRFDPFPFGLLTLIVSLEAIFLSTFVLLSQNRESARSDERADSDFETNVLSEVWLEAVGEKLGVDMKQVHATAKDRIAQSRALASANGNGQATLS
jgi:uncharacterized membrane protein